MTELWAHQKQAIQNAAMIHNYALFFEMGTGKTRTAIEIMRGKFNANGKVLRTLIFTLPLPVPQWKDEWRKFTKLPKDKVTLLQGPGKKRLKDFEKVTADREGRVVVTNYEALLNNALFKAFKDWKPDVIVWDESHKCKSHTAKRSKLAFELSNPHDFVTKRPLYKPHTYLLTGTPYLNSPMDLFQQFKIMDGGQTLGRNFFAFRGQFFRDRNAGIPKDRYFPKWEIMTKQKDGIDGLAELQGRIGPISMRVEKETCLDLPPEVIQPVLVGMNKEQERVYKEMKNELISYYRSKACVANMALTKALRLMQIASGFVAAATPGDESETVELDFGDTPKCSALSELIEEITGAGKKALVWAVFRFNYQQIAKVCEALNVGYVQVHGGVSDKEKLKAVEQFRTDPKIQILIGHPLSGGIGLNLTIAPYSIFYSRNFSLEQWLQARARNHRGGSKEEGHAKITHYNLVCENTIEELAVQKLQGKEDMSDKVLGELIQDLERM